MVKKLLVVVDMQNDFIQGSLGSAEAVKIVPAVKAYIGQAIKAGMDVVFTRDTHHEDYMNTQEGKKLPVLHCIEGTTGWNICDALAEYAEGKKIFDKPAFGSIGLMDYVVEQGYNDITLMGLCTDICVISNAMLIKAALPEARVTVVEDCSAGVTPESHENALAAMKMCQIEIARSSDIG